MSTSLNGRVALITGGGSGIGRAIAERFVEAGARVVMTGRRAEVIQETAREIGAAASVRDRVLAIPGDVSRPDDARRMVEETVAAHGTLDVLVQNAGIARGGPVDAASDDDIDALVDINLKGPIHVMRAAVPHLRRSRADGGASVVQISSSVTFLPPRNFSVYSATKAALEMLTRCWAADLAPDVRVNAISAGVVETPMLEGMVPPEAIDGLRAAFIAQTPLGRLGRPADLAALALYLASDASSWMTGAILPLDGGISLGPPPG